MTGGQNLRAKVARGLQQIAKLDRLVAFQAGHRSFARHVAFGEAVNHCFLEAALIVEHVVGNAETLGHRAGVVNVAAGTAGALAVGRRTVIVELERDADHVIPGVGKERRRD